MAAGGTPLLSESSAEQRGGDFVALDVENALVQRFNAHRWVCVGAVVVDHGDLTALSCLVHQYVHVDDSAEATTAIPRRVQEGLVRHTACDLDRCHLHAGSAGSSGVWRGRYAKRVGLYRLTR